MSYETTKSNPAVAKKPTEGITYSAQDTLPSLPVPPLEQTMEKLIRTCQPFLTESELEHTKACAKDFQNGVGKELQQQLEERASSMRNWVSVGLGGFVGRTCKKTPITCVYPSLLQVEEWWETFAYLRPRAPIAVNTNWHGCLPGTWGPESVTQAQAAAIMIHHILKFREDLIRYVPLTWETAQVVLTDIVLCMQRAPRTGTNGWTDVRHVPV